MTSPSFVPSFDQDMFLATTLLGQWQDGLSKEVRKQHQERLAFFREQPDEVIKDVVGRLIDGTPSFVRMAAAAIVDRHTAPYPLIKSDKRLRKYSCETLTIMKDLMGVAVPMLEDLAQQYSAWKEAVLNSTNMLEQSFPLADKPSQALGARPKKHDDNKFPKKAGVCRIDYMLVDQDGNTCVASYLVSAKKNKVMQIQAGLWVPQGQRGVVEEATVTVWRRDGGATHFDFDGLEAACLETPFKEGGVRRRDVLIEMLADGTAPRVVAGKVLGDRFPVRISALPTKKDTKSGLGAGSA